MWVQCRAVQAGQLTAARGWLPFCSLHWQLGDSCTTLAGWRHRDFCGGVCHDQLAGKTQRTEIKIVEEQDWAITAAASQQRTATTRQQQNEQLRNLLPLPTRPQSLLLVLDPFATVCSCWDIQCPADLSTMV